MSAERAGPVPVAGTEAPGEYELFVDCVDLDASERERRLEAAPPEVAARVRRLLTVHERADDSTGADRLRRELSGATGPAAVGPYRIRQRLGVGAMGEVYLAVQREPVRRLVALKLLRADAATREVVARFAQERHALEVMSHPGIARILDAGEAEDGRSYLAMEYVAGPPITAYCEERRLDLRARVKLMAAVCRAVQHAHFKGVIHRDLKPSNVLIAEVDGVPQPKVIDFGVAKLLQGAAPDVDHYTRLGQLVGTPAYMSPEQALGAPLDVDLRADVWSLGAIFYELLTGTPPHPPRPDEPFHALLARVQAADVERPCRRVLAASTPAHALATGCVGNAALSKALADELDWIALRALERDRTRRFASAEAFAADLDRFVRGEPVESRPPAAWYTLRKGVRRHRVLAAIGATVAAALVVYGFTLLQYTRQLQLERDRANAQASTAQRVTDFVADMFELGTPGSAAERPISARELLESATRRMQERRVAEAPATQAELLGAAGRAHIGLAMYPEARRLLEEALQLRREGARTPEGEARALYDLALLGRWDGNLQAAEAAAREAVQLRSAALGAAHLQTLAARSLLGEVLAESGKVPAALEEYAEARAGFERTGATATPEYGYLLFLQGTGFVAAGRMAEGERTLRAAVAELRRSQGELSNDLANARSNLAEVLTLTGRVDEAEGLHREALVHMRALYGERHPMVAAALNNLGLHLTNVPAKYVEAEQLLEEALAQSVEFRGREHPGTAAALNNLGLAEVNLQQYADAEAHLREALAIRRRVLPPEHPYIPSTMANLAHALRLGGKLAEAESTALAGRDALVRALGADHWRAANAGRLLGDVLIDRGKFAEAERELRAARAALAASLGEAHERVQRADASLARLAERRAGRPGA